MRINGGNKSTIIRRNIFFLKKQVSYVMDVSTTSISFQWAIDISGSDWEIIEEEISTFAHDSMLVIGDQG